MIRSHTFYTYRLLQAIKGFETINKWAAFHHETLDGRGYPFHLKDDSIPLGSRIMAVADIYTALTEDRPYRKGMSAQEAVGILSSMVKNNAICPYSVSMLVNNIEEIEALHRDVQHEAKRTYDYVLEPVK
ncbi:3'3'-cGAMP-specific phosphodiesterase 1 [bioreactor metagenome]|uniref:3'3'-cGAMP-specific phosphodiesterase 1 n=1 Tax=bioreactor metagenome TaxID=1076179 RepID=A0A645CNW8_9ZZZZ